MGLLGLAGDPLALDRLARQLGGHADDLRGYAARLVAAAESVRWQSAAATAFRSQARELAAQLRAAAARIDDAADALHAHAASVRRIRAAVEAADAAVVHAADAGVHVANGAVHVAQRAGSAVVHAIGL